jgi:hypothetical protein
MKKILLLITLILISLSVIPQTPPSVVPNIDWVKYFSERSQISNVPSAIDANSNVYITGYTYPTAANSDITTVKYDALGNVVWIKHYDNGGNDDANAISIDASGSIYVVGVSDGTATTGKDLVVIKYDANGNQLWVARFNGAGNGTDIANAIAFDGTTNVFVTGKTTIAGGTTNFITLKFNASTGAQLFVSTFNGLGNGNDEAIAIDFSSTGRLFVTGTSHNASGNDDITTIRINPNNGNQMWAKTLNGSAASNDRAYSLLSDGNDVVMVGSLKNTTTNDDYVTLKYNGNNGNTLWQKNYDNGNGVNAATAIVKDASNNFVVTGLSLNGSVYEYHTIMYNNSGVQQWVNIVSTGLGYSNANPQIAVAPIANHFYVCGQKSTNVSDILVYQITPTGNKTWEQTFNGAQNNQDAAVDLVVNSTGVLYIAGASLNSNAKFDYTTIRISQTPVAFPIDYNNVVVPFSNAHLFYPNTGEVKDTSGTVVNDVLFYTKHASPKEYVFGNKIAFCLSKQDTNSVNPIDTMVRVDMVFNKTQEKQSVYPFDIQNNNGVINYLLPSYGANGKTDVKGASRLMIPNIYPNIDLHYYSNQKGLKYYFVVKPGGDPRAISLTFNGANSTSLNASNELQVQTQLGNFAFKKPSIYNVSMTLTTPTVTGTNGWVNSALNTYTINTGTYNASLPLVIEIDKGQALAAASPTDNLTWSTYFGDIDNDFIGQMKSDVSNNLYVIGSSSSSILPQGAGVTASQVFQGNYNGTQDGFVAKFDPTGVLLWETYIGGTGQDNLNSFDIANSGAGDLYCVGSTKSTNLLYKGKAGATLVNQSTHATGNNYDGFIFQLEQNGKLYNWLTYYGSTNEDKFNGCKFSPNGSFVIAGTSRSTNLNILGTTPTYTANHTVTNFADGYILKLDATTFNTTWATYIGSNTPNTDDSFGALDINSGNEIFVGGSANGNSYPVLAAGSLNTYNYTNNGYSDGIITRFNNNGKMLWSSYFGGLGTDGIGVIKIDGKDLYFGGGTTDFNTITTKISTKFFSNTIKATNPSFPANPAAEGAFFANYDISNNLVHSTLIGGNGKDNITGIEVDALHNVYISGRTTSTDLDLPPLGNPANTWTANNSGDYDFYIFTMQPNNTNPVWTTQIGGSDNEFFGGGSYIDANNNLYIIGGPKSFANFPWNDGGGTPVWYQDFLAGTLFNIDGSITRLKLSPINFVGIAEHSYNNNGLLLFPNPAQNSITVQLANFKEKATYTIYNNLGQIVTYGNLLNNNTTINLSDFSSGIYLIEIADKTNRLTTKFIKQ